MNKDFNWNQVTFPVKFVILHTDSICFLSPPHNLHEFLTFISGFGNIASIVISTLYSSESIFLCTIDTKKKGGD